MAATRRVSVRFVRVYCRRALCDRSPQGTILQLSSLGRDESDAKVEGSGEFRYIGQMSLQGGAFAPSDFGVAIQRKSLFRVQMTSKLCDFDSNLNKL